MTIITDTQAIVLSAASQRPNAIALPLPESLKGGAAQKVVAAMLAKGLIEEIEAGRDDPVWRETIDGHGVTLIATRAGLAAIGVETGGAAADAPDVAQGAPDVAAAADADAQPPATEAAPTPAPAATDAPKTREGTKQAQLIAMLRAEGGAMAGALKKKLGLEVTSEKFENRGRVYKLPTA